MFQDVILKLLKITSVKNTYGETCKFLLTIRLDLGSVLSPYLFALILDELTAHIQAELSWCMLFVGDIVFVD